MRFTVRCLLIVLVMSVIVIYVSGCGRISSEKSRRLQLRQDGFVEAERLLDKGREKYALRAIEKAVSLAPQEYDSYIIPASLLLRSDLEKEAVPLLERGLKSARAESGLLFTEADRMYRSDLYTKLGFAYWELGRKADAEKAYREAIRHDPDNASAYNDLGYMLADSNMKPDEALRLTKRALELCPNDGNILDSVGWAYFRLGRYEEARKYLQEAVRMNPSASEIRIHLAEVHKSLGNKHAALVEYMKAVRITGSHKGAKDEAQQLAKSLSKKK